MNKIEMAVFLTSLAFLLIVTIMQIQDSNIPSVIIGIIYGYSLGKVLE